MRTTARLSRHLLAATFAALHCRDLLQKAELAAARAQLGLLQDALSSLQGVVLDMDSQRELERLLAEEDDLRRLFIDREPPAP